MLSKEEAIQLLIDIITNGGPFSNTIRKQNEKIAKIITRQTTPNTSIP